MRGGKGSIQARLAPAESLGQRSGGCEGVCSGNWWSRVPVNKEECGDGGDEEMDCVEK
jgi:hypothetical protein